MKQTIACDQEHPGPFRLSQIRALRRTCAAVSPVRVGAGSTLMRSLLAFIGGGAWLTGCVGQFRGEPLYDATSDGRPASDQVAQLSGLVQSVDGRNVPAGRRFELLPGCHVVTNATRWGASDSQGSIAATLRPRMYSIDMRAGYS